MRFLFAAIEIPLSRINIFGSFSYTLAAFSMQGLVATMAFEGGPVQLCVCVGGLFSPVSE